jgi:hypothetical protein
MISRRSTTVHHSRVRSSSALTTLATRSERLHDDLLATIIIGAGLLREPLRQRDCSFGLHPSRRDAHHADTFRRNLFRQAFAVRREGRLRGGIGRGRFRERKFVLD